MAKESGHEWVETEKEVIQYINPRGLGNCPLRSTPKKPYPNEHFTYNGVKVCEIGASQRIEDELNEQMESRVFGSKGATLEGL